MNQELMTNEIPVIIHIILIFGLGTYQTTIAEKDEDIKYNYSDSTTKTTTIPLPFNSHIADRAKDEKKVYSNNDLPFP
jgi:hypothetical protein